MLVRRAREYEVPNLDLTFFAHADDAVVIVGREQPDVVLMDYAMDDHASGEDAIRALRAAFPRGGGRSARSWPSRPTSARTSACSPPAPTTRSRRRHVKGYLSRLVEAEVTVAER